MRNSAWVIWMILMLLVMGCSDSSSSGADGGSDGDADSDSDGDTDSDSDGDFSFALVDTNQLKCWNQAGSEVSCDGSGQDGEFVKNSPSYTDNGDGTVTDNVTGLMWQQGMDEKMNFSDGAGYCGNLDAGGYDDWRIPSIKELYSLMDFSGATGLAGPDSTEVPSDAVPYIDTDFFGFEYGDVTQGERYIDAQWLTSTIYVSQVMNGQECSFGVNHADGRIKCYPTQDMGDGNFRFRCVRGKTDYGVNDFEDNGDDTITDNATGLVWMKKDSAILQAGDLQDGTMDWQQAITYCDGLDYGGHDDWRLPDAKELQSIVDYDLSPDTTGSAAISSIFEAGVITNEMGDDDYGYYWASTTHLDGLVPGAAATYVAFGRAIGQMQGTTMDVHGAGAQRSDPKTGDRADYPVLGMGPQGDSQRVFNMVRCVRN